MLHEKWQLRDDLNIVAYLCNNFIIHSPNQYQKQNSRINKQKIPQVLAFLKCGLPFFVLSKLLEKWRISFRPHFGNAAGLREFYCKCFKNQTCNCKTRLTNKCRVLFLRSKTIFNCSFSSVSCFVGHPVQCEIILLTARENTRFSTKDEK